MAAKKSGDEAWTGLQSGSGYSSEVWNESVDRGGEKGCTADWVLSPLIEVWIVVWKYRYARWGEVGGGGMWGVGYRSYIPDAATFSLALCFVHPMVALFGARRCYSGAATPLPALKPHS